MDPYFQSHRDVVMGISQLHSMLDNRTDILNDPRGGNPEIFRTIGSEMSNAILALRDQLKEIGATVRIVRANPARFSLSETQVKEREQFLSSTLREIDEIELQMNGQTSNQRSQFHVSSFEPISPIPASGSRAPVHELVLAPHQEEQLDMIAENVRIQKHIGTEISNTLDEQREMIIELETGIDDAHTAMTKVTQQITQLIDHEGRVPTYLVALLSVVLILMLWWVA
jgi:hypothetical protein